MKILFLFPRLGIGGVSKSLAFVANAYTAEGHSVVALSMSNEPQTVNLSPSIKKEFLPLPSSRSRLFSLFLKLYWSIRFRLKVRHHKPDWIVVFRPDLTKAVMFSLLKMKHKPKILASERGNPKAYGERWKNYKSYYNKCTGVVFQTPQVQDFYSLSTSSYIIPNPAVSRLGASTQQRTLGQNIISVGRLSPEKNFEGLIQAFALCRPYLPESKLIIYGDGEHREVLAHLIKSLNLEEFVLMPGNVADFVALDDDAGLFVLNSLTEGMPNSLIEAMLAGLPCVASDCPSGGVAWLSDNGRRAKLVPVNDATALTTAIQEVFSDQSLRNSLIRNSAELDSLLNPEIIRERWVDIIRTL